MKHRNVMAVVFLSIITLGIYDLFWLVKTKKVLNAQTKIHTPTIWLLFSPLVVIVLAALLLLATNASSGAGSGSAIIVLLFEFVAVLAFVPITFFWFFKFSKAVNEYTNGEMNTAVTFLLLWLIRFIGLAIIQDKFNDMTLAAATPAQAGAAMPSAASVPDAPYPAAAPAEQPVVSSPPVAPVTPVVAAPEAPLEPVTPAQPAPVEQPPVPEAPAPEPAAPVAGPTQFQDFGTPEETAETPQQPPTPPAGPTVQ